MKTIPFCKFPEDDERTIKRLIKKLKLSRDSVLHEAEIIYRRHSDPFIIKKRDERDLYKLGRRKHDYEQREEERHRELLSMGRDKVALLIENRDHIILYSRAILTALEDALEYDPVRHHNRPPPALYLQDNAYLNELRSLVDELRTLNQFLVAHKEHDAERRLGSLAKHLNEFMSNYSQSLGKAAAALTAASIVALLYQVGVGREIIDAISRHLR